MASLKGIVLVCMTILIVVGAGITYHSQQDRYVVYPHEKGLFIFDRKTATLNFCDSETCQMVKPSVNQEPETMVVTVPAQNAIVNGSMSMQQSPRRLNPQQQRPSQPGTARVPAQQMNRSSAFSKTPSVMNNQVQIMNSDSSLQSSEKDNHGEDGSANYGEHAEY